MSVGKPRLYLEPLLRELPRLARWYIVSVIVLGALTFVVLVPRATLTRVTPLAFLVLLSSLTAAFKIQFPIASGSNMSVSYVVDIAALILRGPHATDDRGCRGAGLTRQLLAFSRRQVTSPRVFALGDVI